MNSMLSERKLFNNPGNEFLSTFREGLREGYKDILYHKNLIENNLLDLSNQSYEFIIIELPYMEICSSSYFTYATNEEMWDQKKNNIYEPIAGITLNIIPFDNKLKLIFGYLKEFKESISRLLYPIQQMDYNQKLKKLSDLLLLEIETWVCSPSLYNNNLKQNEETILNIMYDNCMGHGIEPTVEFNMFQDLIPNGK
ncbi:MAG: hypothetical protein V1779_00025 [bacterium]